MQLIGNLLIGAPLMGEQDNPRPLHHSLLGLALTHPSLQSLLFLIA
jgi:hypothetical protein